MKLAKKLNINNIVLYEQFQTALIPYKKIQIEIATARTEEYSSDSRKPEVQSTSIGEDLSRRDFTINSIYADIDGNLYDPFNGKRDLELGKVEFIGDIEKRIKEDYLRIMRYIRFHLKYGKLEHEKKTIIAIKKNINGINNISKERIFSELIKILDIDVIQKLKRDNQVLEIFCILFPQLKYFDRIEKIKFLISKTNLKVDYCLTLAILLSDKQTNIEYWIYKYKIPNKIKNRLLNISKYIDLVKEKIFISEQSLKKIIYLHLE